MSMMHAADMAGLHWSAAYLGQPWANAPNSDCWGFVRRVWRDRWALDVPPLSVDATSARACARAAADVSDGPQWLVIELAQAHEGDAVLMARGGHPSHVGLWVATGGVLHCLQGRGVVYTPAGRLAAQGWPQRRIYRHASGATLRPAAVLLEPGA